MVQRALDELEGPSKRGWQRRSVGTTMPQALARAGEVRTRCLSVALAEADYKVILEAVRGAELTASAVMREALGLWLTQRGLAVPPTLRPGATGPPPLKPPPSSA